MTLYVLPASPLGLNDKLFKSGPNDDLGGFSNYQYWRSLKRACEKQGIAVHTSDLWSREKSQPDDILFVQDHPGQLFFWRLFYRLKNFKIRGGYVLAKRDFLMQNYTFFKKRVLWHSESPVATPEVFERIDKIWESGIYTKIILISRPPVSPKNAGGIVYLDYYSMREKSLESPYFTDPKTKFLVMINSNTAPHSLGDEQYGERLRAVKYFATRDPAEQAQYEFDLYGHRWNQRPRHPRYFMYKKYVDKVWHGTVEDKMKTLSEYKFSLCFENCSYPGYISEKIFDCLGAGTIPIYHGAPNITEIVPASCFIDFKKFKDYDELYAHLRSLTEADIAKYRADILTFLRDDSSMRGMQSLIDIILA